MAGPDYVISVDLGQAADFTAIGILKRVPQQTGQTKDLYSKHGQELSREYSDHFHLVYAHRVPLHTSYPDQVATIVQLCGRAPGSYQVIADATGVGRPVVDLMRQAGLPVIGCVITAGLGQSHQNKETGFWMVPKRELVTRAQTYMQQGRLKIGGKLKLADIIVKELLAFRMRISTTTGNASFEAWRDQAHDDLVLMLCMGVWWGHQTRTGWKKDSGPHKDFDRKMRDVARAYFTEEDASDWSTD